MDTLRFEQSCSAVLNNEKANCGIGTLSEKSMHAVLKRYFEPDESRHEISVGGFVADIVNENGIIEIQSRSLHGMNKKLDAFLQCCNVTVVFPIVDTKRILWTDKDTGEVKISKCGQRKKKLSFALHEIYYLRKYLENPRFSICLLHLEADDYRIQLNKSKSRKNCICDRFPTKLKEQFVIEKYEDFLHFLPDNLPYRFTTSDVANAARMPLDCAQSLMYYLYSGGIAQRVGKDKNSYLYELKL